MVFPSCVPLLAAAAACKCEKTTREEPVAWLQKKIIRKTAKKEKKRGKEK